MKFALGREHDGLSCLIGSCNLLSRSPTFVQTSFSFWHSWLAEFYRLIRVLASKSMTFRAFFSWSFRLWYGKVLLVQGLYLAFRSNRWSYRSSWEFLNLSKIPWILRKSNLFFLSKYLTLWWVVYDCCFLDSGLQRDTKCDVLNRLRLKKTLP